MNDKVMEAMIKHQKQGMDLIAKSMGLPTLEEMLRPEPNNCKCECHNPMSRWDKCSMCASHHPEQTEIPEQEGEEEVECHHECTSNCRRVGCNCECGEYHKPLKDFSGATDPQDPTNLDR